MPKKKVGGLAKSQDFVEVYRSKRSLYELFATRIADLLKQLLEDEGIKYQAIEHRAKEVESFAEKIAQPGKKYDDPIQEITDLAGVRIIVYYQSDVDAVCHLIDEEFLVNQAYSSDKKTELALDQFGYLSVHKVVSLSSSRDQLPEWASFTELAGEIQIRTVLQHAWASISHALQYKREADIPSNFRRKLVRLSGLLELADDEFSQLKIEQSELGEKIRDHIEKDEFEFEIDALSLNNYLASADTLKPISKAIEDAGFNLARGEDREDIQLSNACRVFGFKSMQELDRELGRLQKEAEPFFREFARLAPSGAKNVGGHLDHFCVVLLMGARAKELTVQKAMEVVPWHEKYVQRVMKSGKVFS